MIVQWNGKDLELKGDEWGGLHPCFLPGGSILCLGRVGADGPW